MALIKTTASRHLGDMDEERTSKSLVAAAAGGDTDAWERLAEAWLPTVHAWCVRLGGPRLDPLDLTQEVFVLAFTRLHTLRDPAAFPAWILGITRREILRQGRRAWLRRWLPGLEPPVRPAPGGPVHDAEQAALIREVHEVLDRLPRTQREVLVLCDVEERTSLEVAGLLGIPHGTVRSRLRAARERFREEADGRLPSLALGGEA